jgi:hypothetical protein
MMESEGEYFAFDLVGATDGDEVCPDYERSCQLTANRDLHLCLSWLRSSGDNDYANCHSCCALDGHCR